MNKCVEAIQLISFGSLCVRVVYLKQKSNGVSYSERIFVCSKNVECRHFNQFISVDASFFNRTMCVCVCLCASRFVRHKIQFGIWICAETFCHNRLNRGKNRVRVYVYMINVV